MLSAHGSAPEVVAAARASGGYVVDAVCPLVTKVHHEVKVRAGKGYQIVYVGHEGHEEAVGTMAVAPDVDPPGRDASSEVAALPDFDEPVALLAQTTLSPPRLGRRRRRPPASASPTLWMPGPQRPVLRHHQPPVGAARAWRRRCDAIVVIGSANSSNTRALGEAGPRGRLPAGAAGSTTADELPDDLHGIVGVTAGASAPEELVEPGDRAPRRPPTASRRCRSPTRTSTSRRPATCGELLAAIDVVATFTLGGSVPVPAPGRGPHRAAPATCWPRSPEARTGRP